MLQIEGMSGVLADLGRSIYQQESGGGRNTKTSYAQAHGGMQIIPGTFAAMADKGWDINNPEHNTRAGLRYIKDLFNKHAGGDPRLAAIGYYGGPGAIKKARQGVAVHDPRNANAPSTFQYADKVMSRIGRGNSYSPQIGNYGTGTQTAMSNVPTPTTTAPELYDPRAAAQEAWNAYDAVIAARKMAEQAAVPTPQKPQEAGDKETLGFSLPTLAIPTEQAVQPSNQSNGFAPWQAFKAFTGWGRG